MFEWLSRASALASLANRSANCATLNTTDTASYRLGFTLALTQSR